MEIRYLNLKKPRRHLSNINFKPDTVVDAHTEDHPICGFTAFVDKASFDLAIETLKLLDNPLAKKTLEMLGYGED